jgi:hypothetical protein
MIKAVKTASVLSACATSQSANEGNNDDDSSDEELTSEDDEDVNAAVNEQSPEAEQVSDSDDIVDTIADDNDISGLDADCTLPVTANIHRIPCLQHQQLTS